MPPRILHQNDTFALRPGRIISRKYEVIEKLGEGWEGEVYKFKDLRTGIEHAAKIFFPGRDPRGNAVTTYAQKLYRLRNCSMVVRYHTEEIIRLQNKDVTVLISEFISGEILESFLQRQRGRRLPPFIALHLLHSLCQGMEEIHDLGEYHGDLHTENIIVAKYGLRFELKLLDMYNWGKTTAAHRHYDTVDMIRVFYDTLGGQKYYATQPKSVKQICCGLKRSLILKKYKNAGELRRYLEKMEWQD